MTNEIVPSAATARLHAVQARAAEDWQDKILPFVKWGIGVLAVVVFAAVLAAGWRVLHNVENGSEQSGIFAKSLNAAVAENYPNVARLNAALTSFEAAREQDRAGAELLTRELLRFSSFLIGAALCFVGSIFVMGKFSEVSPIAANAENGALKASISTASPGLFAITVGACLVGVGVFAHYPVVAQRPSVHAPATAQGPAGPTQADSALVSGWKAQMNEVFGEKPK